MLNVTTTYTPPCGLTPYDPAFLQSIGCAVVVTVVNEAIKQIQPQEYVTTLLEKIVNPAWEALSTFAGKISHFFDRTAGPDIPTIPPITLGIGSAIPPTYTAVSAAPSTEQEIISKINEVQQKLQSLTDSAPDSGLLAYLQKKIVALEQELSELSPLNKSHQETLMQQLAWWQSREKNTWHHFMPEDRQRDVLIKEKQVLTTQFCNHMDAQKTNGDSLPLDEEYTERCKQKWSLYP